MKVTRMKYEMLLLQRCSNGTENIVLTILHHMGEWDREGLLEFNRQYRTMVRKWLAGDKETDKKMAAELAAVDPDLFSNLDRDEYRGTEKLWRNCLLCAFAVLRQTGSTEEIKNVEICFGDWMEAVKEHYKEEVDLMKETMAFISKPFKEVENAEEVIANEGHNKV